MRLSSPAVAIRNDWLQAVKKNSSLLGGLGLKVENLPTPVNKFENGKLTLGVTNLKVEVGGFLMPVQRARSKMPTSRRSMRLPMSTSRAWRRVRSTSTTPRRNLRGRSHSRLI